MNWVTLTWREPLWLLLALVPWALLLLRLWRSQTGIAYADRALLPWLRVGEERGILQRLVSRNTAYVIAWMLLAIALAGPRHLIQTGGGELPSGRTLLAVVDLSRSMAATDVQPNRRRRAKLELYELLEHVRGDRVGVLVFAGRAHRYVPPTTDLSAVRFYLNSLDRLVLPTRGSDISLALDMATRTLAAESAPAVILLSDGDFGEKTARLERTVQKLTAAGIPLYVLGIGTPQGEAIPLPEGGWLKQDGKPVISQLDEAGLQTMATQGNGVYRRVADNDSDWAALYDRGIAQSRTVSTGHAGAEQTQWHEHYPWFLLPSLILFYLSVMPYRLPGLRGAGTLLWCIACISLPTPNEALAADGTPRQSAEQAWHDGNYSESASHYAAIPGFIGRMGEGASYYRSADYIRAAGQFSQAVLLAGNDSQRGDALYNLGNSLFRQGNYDTAVQVFADVLRYRKDDARTKHNLALSQALQQAVAARQEQEGMADRAGRGPKSARAPEGMNIGDKSSLTIDDSDTPAEALPPLPDNVELLITNGLNHIRLANSKQDAETSLRWQQDMAQARLRMQGLQEEPETIWRRLFEVEEGFPAPVHQPRNLPGVSPW